MGREGETPAQIFWHIGVQKKWYKLSKLGGGGGVEVIWTKSKRTATFFRETVPKGSIVMKKKKHFPPLPFSYLSRCLQDLEVS